MPQGSVLGPLLFLLYTSELFSILENMLIGYVDRATVAESLIRDPGRVSGWCDLSGMILNASKAKTMIISRLSTMHPQSPPLTIGGIVQESDDLACYIGSDI